jgi:hypothetical protein
MAGERRKANYVFLERKQKRPDFGKNLTDRQIQ